MFITLVNYNEPLASLRIVFRMIYDVFEFEIK